MGITVNISKAKKIAEKLKEDKQFYLHCSNKAKKSYRENFHENKFNTTR